jgi:hypothetical protein
MGKYRDHGHALSGVGFKIFLLILALGVPAAPAAADDFAAGQKFTVCKTWNFSSMATANGINDYGQIAGSVVNTATGAAGSQVEGYVLFPDGTEKVFDVPLTGGGASETSANGIDNNGDVVGGFASGGGLGTGSAPTGGLSAFLGTISAAGFTLSKTWQFDSGGGANGVNDQGQVVGEFEGVSNHVRGTHGYVLFPPVPTGTRKTFDLRQFKVPGTGGTGSRPVQVNEAVTDANGINDHRRVVGDFLIATHTRRGKGTNGTAITDADRSGFVGTVSETGGFQPKQTWNFGGESTRANGINDAGKIVGDFFGKFKGVKGTHGYVLSGASRLNFDVESGSRGSSGIAPVTHANGINNCGQIVGTLFSENASGSESAFLGTIGPGSCTPGCVDALAHLKIAPGFLNFGKVPHGSPSNPQEVTITNLKGSFPLMVTMAAPGVSANYMVAGNNCPTTLLPGNSCTLMITFNPTGQGSAPGTLTINDNAVKNPQALKLSGQGT